MSNFCSDPSSTSILYVCEQWRLWRDFADCLSDKYHNLMSWLNYSEWEQCKPETENYPFHLGHLSLLFAFLQTSLLHLTRHIKEIEILHRDKLFVCCNLIQLEHNYIAQPCFTVKILQFRTPKNLL